MGTNSLNSGHVDLERSHLWGGPLFVNMSWFSHNIVNSTWLKKAPLALFNTFHRRQGLTVTFMKHPPPKKCTCSRVAKLRHFLPYWGRSSKGDFCTLCAMKEDTGGSELPGIVTHTLRQVRTPQRWNTPSSCLSEKKYRFVYFIVSFLKPIAK